MTTGIAVAFAVRPAQFAKTLFGALLLLISLMLLAVTATPAKAHGFNESYVYFDVDDDNLSGRVEVTLTDLTRIQQRAAEITNSLDRDAVRDQQDAFFDYFAERVTLSWNGEPLPIEFIDITFFDTAIDTFAQLHFDVLDIDETPTTIQMSYTGLLSDIDPEHRGYALIGSNSRNGMDENEAYISLTFSPGDGVKDLYLNDEPTRRIARGFFELGIWHAWLGFDHILFLVTLLLGAVMRIENQRFVPSENIAGSLWHTTKIVTIFTIANTVALGLAMLGVITLPVALVEAVIVLSIAAVAVGNITPRFHSKVWIAVLIYGAFHGFGFASVLEPLGSDPARQAMGLGSFNIGIEIGQLAVVLVLFPIFFALRNLPAYRRIGLQFGSVALIAIAMVWFLERTAGWFPKLGETVVLLVN